MCYTPESITATVLPRRVTGPAQCRVPTRPAPRHESAPAVAIHARADRTSTAVGVLRRDEQFTVQVTDGTWRHVTTASGITGWVADRHVRRDERTRPY
ncbi:SH3 domain-containing protein [Streptomyces lavendulae]|uniref:SH3 domain-containing protein n=1 Tax=Streptomyces lavendulae TaxID=1914 RepID=UPI0033EFCA9A